MLCPRYSRGNLLFMPKGVSITLSGKRATKKVSGKQVVVKWTQTDSLARWHSPKRVCERVHSHTDARGAKRHKQSSFFFIERPHSPLPDRTPWSILLSRTCRPSNTINEKQAVLHYASLKLQCFLFCFLWSNIYPWVSLLTLMTPRQRDISCQRRKAADNILWRYHGKTSWSF